MKQFFANMNLARWIVVLSILASIGLGVFGWKLHERRLQLEGALVTDVPKTAQDIQVASRRYSRLYKEFEREGLKAQDNPEQYIRSLASNPKVGLGSVNVLSKKDTRANNVADLKFTITPLESKAAHNRDRIANYMWLLEQESRRVRVTSISLDQKGKFEPWETGNDQWEWEIEVTSRQKIEG